MPFQEAQASGAQVRHAPAIRHLQLQSSESSCWAAGQLLPVCGHRMLLFRREGLPPGSRVADVIPGQLQVPSKMTLHARVMNSCHMLQAWHHIAKLQQECQAL